MNAREGEAPRNPPEPEKKLQEGGDVGSKKSGSAESDAKVEIPPTPENSPAPEKASKTDGVKQPEKPGIAALDERELARIQEYRANVYGPTGDRSTGYYNIDARNFYTTTRQRIEDLLHPADEVPAHDTYHDSDAVATYAKVLLERNFIVVSWLAGAHAEARSAVYTLLEHVKGIDSSLRRFTCSDERPPLRLFLREDSWMESLSNSIVYLYLKDKLSPPLWDEEARTICAKLSRAHCHLVLVSRQQNKPGRAAVEVERAQARLPEWRIPSKAPASTESEEVADLDLSEPVGQTLVFAAAVTPGLPAAEYLRVCEHLMPALDPGRKPPKAEAAQDGESAESQFDRTSRLARWHSGERDALLRAHEIRFTLARDEATPLGDLGSRGFYVKNADISVIARDRLFETAPIFLIEKLGPMTELYLGDRWSDAFCSGFRDYVCRLHTEGLKRLTPDWLGERFFEIEKGKDPDQGLYQFRQVAETLADLPDGPDILARCFARIADRVREDESHWHARLRGEPIEALAAELAREIESAEEADASAIEARNAERIMQFRQARGLDHEFLGHLDRSGYRFIALMYISVGVRLGNEAFEVLASAIAGPDTRSGLDRLGKGNAAFQALVSPIRGGLFRAARFLVEKLPEGFQALAEGVLASLPAWGVGLERAEGAPGTDARRSSESDRVRASAAQLASEALLQAFASFVDDKAGEGLPDRFVKDVLAPDGGRRCGRAIFALTYGRRPRGSADRRPRSRGARPIEPGWIVWLTDRLCQGLLNRKGARESQVLPVAVGFASQIRGQIEAAELDVLIDEARFHEAMFEERAQVWKFYKSVSTGEDRELYGVNETREFQRSRLIGMAIRGFSTRTSAPTDERDHERT